MTVIRWEAVTLAGSRDALDRWTDLWPPPVYPNVRKLAVEQAFEGDRYLLFSDAFEKLGSAEEVLGVAKALLQEMNGISELLDPHSPHARPDAIEFGGMVIGKRADGTYAAPNFVEVGTAFFRSRFFPAVISGGTPAPTKAQRFKTVTSDELVNALRDFARANNWHDLYKTFENVETSGMLGDVKQRLKVSNNQIGRFTQTASHYRHGFGKAPPLPRKPMTLAEAHEFVRRLLESALEGASHSD